MNTPFITRRATGEYSTIVLPDGRVETCWFADDGYSEVIGRSIHSYKKLEEYAALHIYNYEEKK